MNIVNTILLIIGASIAVYLVIILMIFIIPSLPAFSGAKPIDKALSNQYYYKDEKVVFSSNGNFFSLGSQEIEGVDKESFEVLANNYAKDKNHVYYDDKILEGMKPQNLELMAASSDEGYSNYTSYFYIKNKENVFFLYTPIEGADAVSFAFLAGLYSEDKNTLFYSEKKISDRTEQLKFVKNDSKNTYIQMGEILFYRGEVVQNSFKENLEILQFDFSKDGTSVYYYAKRYEDIDARTFEIINEHYQKDKNSLYYKADRIEGSDPSSYEKIDFYFSKDKYQVYYFGNIVMNVKVQEFDARKAKSLDSDRKLIQLHHDDSHLFYAKRSELKTINSRYNQYKQDIYIATHRFIGATPENIKYLDADSYYTQVNGKTYYQRELIQQADEKSFVVINEDFAKDKNYVYRMEKELINISPDKFIYKEGMYSEDIDDRYARLVDDAEELL